MNIEIITVKIDVGHLKSIAESQFGDMVKGVVDIEKEIIAIAGELHADEEGALLAEGSSQENLWGINLYVDTGDDDWIEFDSMINIRPSQGNKSRDVEDAEIRDRIVAIVNRLIRR